MTSADDVLLEKIGRAGVVTLNRPKALNALTHGMVRLIAPQLKAWAADPAVHHVVIRQTGEKAFCAGGDIRASVEDIRAGRFDEALAFFRDEYRLNRLIKRFPKPYVALIDGIVMGGGVGLSVHGSHRIATERLVFAMPEVGIGFFPDVGGTYFLPRLPGKIGLWLALTGERIGLADAAFAGITTHHVPSADLPALFQALTVAVDVDATLRLFMKPAPRGELVGKRAALDMLLAGDTLEDLLAGLKRRAEVGDAQATAMLATLSTRSPTAVAIAFEQMRRGVRLDFEAAMQLEFRIVSRVVRGRDYPEGVRAVIFDKDNAPVWFPRTLDELDPDAVALHFLPLDDGELDFPA
jgi:enoyl-CoA hydratase